MKQIDCLWPDMSEKNPPADVWGFSWIKYLLVRIETLPDWVLMPSVLKESLMDGRVKKRQKPLNNPTNVKFKMKYRTF